MITVLNSKISSQSDFDTFYKTIEEVITDYPYYHFQNYPSKNKNGWMNLFFKGLKSYYANENHYLFYEISNGTPIFIIYHVNKWDEDHFGIRMASSTLVFSFPDISHNTLSNFIKQVIKYLEELGVQFVSTLINGDNLSIIHAHLDNQFRYYETIVWPILNTEDHSNKIKACKILTDENKLPIVKKIAENYQYQRGHYHCDYRFKKVHVNSMYSKWVETSFYSNDTVCIIEENGEIVGYFICGIDSLLEKHLGYRYGRLKSLALNSEYRGKGLGGKLFANTLSYLKKNGCDYIDSGYATKNHVSSFLHSSNFFHSNYEEVRLHYWTNS